MKRTEQIVENTWDLKKMYDENNIEKDLEILKKDVSKMAEFQNVDFNEKNIIEVLDLYFAFMIKIENIYVYFSHLQDTDFSNNDNIAKFNRIKAEYNEMDVTLSFIIPKISSCSNEILNKILENKEVKEYHKTIRNIILNKKRYLSEKEEKIISSFGFSSGTAYQVFSSFTNSDLKFPDIIEDGETKVLTEGTYSNYIRGNNREVRRQAFSNLLATYSNYNQTLATTLISKLKESYVSMKIRGYETTLQQSLEPKKLDEKIYYNLLNTIEENISINHDYIELRKNELGYDQLHLYDMYVPMVKEINNKYPFIKAKEMILEAFSNFDNEYLKVLNQAFDNRWIDIYENEGKRTGAYSGGSYLSDSYILMNYHDELNDVFTLAHELGHSLHSHFSNKNNPYQNANYKIFIAEIASTVNELILINYLLNKESDSLMKKYLYNYLLEQFRTTMIRQTMFARFELEIYKLIEQNQPISASVLNELYYSINKKYFGDNVELDDLIKYEYLRIPHFYYDYYVYQYATSFSVSLNIVKRILNKEKDITKKYLDFLKLGDSLFPLEALKTIDIDLTDSTIFENAMINYQDIINKYRDVE